MNAPNRVRIFGSIPIKMRFPIRRTRFHVFGCMLLNGKDVVLISDRARSDDFITLLRLIRRHNPFDTIVLIVDNASIHTSMKTLDAAAELDIKLVFLPPYSPDLNPIEFSWRDCKRELWLRDVNTARITFKSTFLSYVNERKLSYSRRWLRLYGKILASYGVILNG